MFTGPMNTIQAGDVRFQPVLDIPEGIGNRWEFELSLVPTESKLEVSLYYSRELYEREWATAFVAKYTFLAEVASANPDLLLDSLPF
jgi:hypothetical protein